MKSLIIAEFPSNLGLKEPKPGKQPGVYQLPAALRANGFHDLVNPKQIIMLRPPAYTMYLDPESEVRNADAIATYALAQSELLTPLITGEHFIIALGGDCSILLGNALALKQSGKFALFFLDGHTDFMLPDFSGTKGAAGMDLAFATGHGHPKLSDIRGMGPYFQEQHAWCVGNRDLDADYVALIRQSDIHYVSLDDIRKTGIENICFSFLKMLDDQQLNGCWIHLDVDVLDDELMPAVDSREKGGLTYSELKSLLSILLSSGKTYGMEITILDPDLDPDGVYTKQFVTEIGHLIRTEFNSSLKAYQK